MMLDRSELQRAVDMQQRSYRLLKWMAAAVRDGFIDFKTAHTYSNFPEAAESWILGHYLNIPADARVGREEMSCFTAMFSTYVQNSFDLIASPGKQLYSPDAHCFCPMCSWLVDAPNLQTKRISPTDKRRAEKLRITTLKQIALDHNRSLPDTKAAVLLAEDRVREDSSLVAYGYDLLARMRGIANGPAILSLWRGFAWTKSGSPKPKFKLEADCICDAEKRLATAITTVE